MNNSELAELIDWIEDRYGRQRLWEKASRLGPYDDHQLLEDFGRITLGAALEAAHDMFTRGAPRIAPFDLIGPARSAWRARVEAGVDPEPEAARCAGAHTWALASPVDLALASESPEAFKPTDVCAACGEERPARMSDSRDGAK